MIFTNIENDHIQKWITIWSTAIKRGKREREKKSERYSSDGIDTGILNIYQKWCTKKVNYE